MPLYIPRDESPEGWRRSSLGFWACLFGWHFGQIALSPPWETPIVMECARCKKPYRRKI